MFPNQTRSGNSVTESRQPSEIEQLRTLLYTDDLTGLYNRRFFRHCISEQKTESETTGSAFALLMIDVDHFKQINDTYGHAVGDDTLIKVADALKSQLRDKGWVFRYAGDEFVAVLRGCNEDRIETLCSQILSSISEICTVKDDSYPVTDLTVSIGSVVFAGSTNSISDLLEEADRALYASKRAGRNQYCSSRMLLEKKRPQWPVSVQCQPLIGRQNQWNILQQHFAECKNRHGRLVLVSGDAGIGKSRLVRHFIRRQRVSEHHILFGECAEGTMIHSYAPVRDALRKGFEAKDPATINVYRDLSPQHRAELIGLVPQFGRFEKIPLPPGRSSDKYLLLESILLLLQGLSRQFPTLLILEDIHWSDESTLNLIQYLARNIRNERILLIGTFRGEEAVHITLPSILQNMSRENLFERIELKPLSSTETRAMVDEIFQGYSVPQEIGKWIFDETEGNPFYIEEFLKMLLEEKYLNRNESNLILSKPAHSVLPYSIRALVQRRVGRLDDSLKKILSLASIIGQEFDLTTLAKLSDEKEGYLLDLLERLTRLQLIEEQSESGEEQFRFSHNKIRDVIYEDIGHIRRKKYHFHVGTILEELHIHEIPMYAEELAYHFERSGEPLRAFRYSVEAGKKSLQMHASSEALRHLERCFHYKELQPEGISADQLVELYTCHGAALEDLGKYDDAIQSYEMLISLKDQAIEESLDIRALNFLSSVFYKKENFSKSLLLAQQALELSRDRDHAEGICTSYHNISKNYWRLCAYENALQAVDGALEATKNLSDPVVRGNLLNMAGILRLERSDYFHALQSFQEAYQIFQAQNDKQGIIECLVNTAIIRHLQGESHEARQHCINAYALAQETGEPYSIASCCVNQAELELKLANFDMGNRLNDRASNIYRELNYELGQTYSLENEARFHLYQGRLTEALKSISKARIISEKRNLLKRNLEILKTETAILMFRGDFMSALHSLENWCDLCNQMRNSQVELAEAGLKRGFIAFALQDFSEAVQQWKRVVEPSKNDLPLEFKFWKTAAAGFLSISQKEESEVLRLQNQLKHLAHRSEFPYFMTAFHLLCSYQFQLMQDWENALKYSQEGEDQAALSGQKVWLIRCRINSFEILHRLKQPFKPDQIHQILEDAKQQGQNQIVHRCYRLLWEIEPELDQFQANWVNHWAGWSPQIPDHYHDFFRPAVQSEN